MSQQVWNPAFDVAPGCLIAPPSPLFPAPLNSGGGGMGGCAAWLACAVVAAAHLT